MPGAVPEIDGSYRLVRYGSSLLPAPIVPLPDANGQPTNCWLTLAEGSLTATAANHLFQSTWTYRASCDGRVLGIQNVSGQFTQSGALLTFHTPGEGGDVPFQGEVRGDTVIAKQGTPYLYFTRP